MAPVRKRYETAETITEDPLNEAILRPSDEPNTWELKAVYQMNDGDDIVLVAVWQRELLPEPRIGIDYDYNEPPVDP